MVTSLVRETAIGKACAMALVLGAMPAICQTGAKAPPVSFHVIGYISKFDEPVGMAEASPGLFFAMAGTTPPAVLSITAEGKKTVITTFPENDNLASVRRIGAPELL